MITLFQADFYLDYVVSQCVDLIYEESKRGGFAVSRKSFEKFRFRAKYKRFLYFREQAEYAHFLFVF